MVPIDATTHAGVCPFDISSTTLRLSASGHISKLLPVRISRTLSLPKPAIFAPFSVEECASSEVYTISDDDNEFIPSLLVRQSVAFSRAVNRAHNVALEAES